MSASTSTSYPCAYGLDTEKQTTPNSSSQLWDKVKEQKWEYNFLLCYAAKKNAKEVSDVHVAS